MARALITAEGVLNAITECDAIGEDAFLDRYGFNGARGYNAALIARNRRWRNGPIY